MGELNLPPLRFRKFGFFNFFVTNISPSVFASKLVSNDVITTLPNSPEIKENFSNIGIQFDTNFVMFSHLSSSIICRVGQGHMIITKIIFHMMSG